MRLVCGMKKQMGCAKILFINFISLHGQCVACLFFTMCNYSIESKLCMVVCINFCSQNQGCIINHEVTRKIFMLAFSDGDVLCGVLRWMWRQQQLTFRQLRQSGYHCS